MSQHELEALGRAHQLFAGSSPHWAPDPSAGHYRDLLQRATELNIDAGQDHYQRSASRSRAVLASAGRTDSALAAIIAAAHRDRASARELTGRVLDEARADAAVTSATPLAQREAMRRRAARLHAQRAHVVSARGRARRHLAALRALRYRMSHHRSAGCRRPTAAPGSRYGPRSRGWAVRMSGGRPGPISSTAPGWCNGPMRKQVCISTAPPMTRSTTEFPCRARWYGPATWSFRTPDMSRWRSATTWWSKLPTRVHRSGSAGWAATCRFGDRCEREVEHMSHGTGSSVAALRQRQAALASKHRAVADADRVLSEALAGAHEAMRQSVRRLDADRRRSRARTAVRTRRRYPTGIAGIPTVSRGEATCDRRCRRGGPGAQSREKRCAAEPAEPVLKLSARRMPPPIEYAIMTSYAVRAQELFCWRRFRVCCYVGGPPGACRTGDHTSHMSIREATVSRLQNAISPAVSSRAGHIDNSARQTACLCASRALNPRRHLRQVCGHRCGIGSGCPTLSTRK